MSYFALSHYYLRDIITIHLLSSRNIVFHVVVQPRPMVPNKDTTLYGYGSVAWRDRLEDWKKKQSDRLQVIKQQRNHSGEIIEIDVNNPDSPL